MNGYCELFIYKDCKILKNKNFKVDDIQDYLSTLTPLNLPNQSGGYDAIQGQWMKHQLRLKYVINFSETDYAGFEQYGRGQEFTSFENEFNFNYLVAQNVDTWQPLAQVRTRKLSKVYYFIVGKRWMSESAIELELEMDVINTFADYLHFSQKTTIIRQHKNRWKKGRKVGNTQYFEPVIDPYSEGLVFPLYKKTEETQYYRGDNLDVDNNNWYLIFRSLTTDTDSPIRMMACSDVEYATGYGTLGYNGSKDPVGELRGSPFNEFWVIYGNDAESGHNNVGATISFTSNTGAQTLEITSTTQAIVISRNLIFIGTVDGSYLTVTAKYVAGWLKRFRNVDFREVYKVRYSFGAPSKQQCSVGSQYPSLNSSAIENMPTSSDFPTTQTRTIIGAIDDIDRTDPKLLKIIKLPYPPFNLEFDTSSTLDEPSVLLPTGWGVQEGDENYFPNLFLYGNENTTECFDMQFFPVKDGSHFGTNPFAILHERTLSMSASLTPRNKIYESKLLHSDYFQRKYVYDSFYYIVKAELYDTSYYRTENDNIGIQFCITATMNSRFMFRFGSLLNQKATMFFNTTEVGDMEDYSNILYVARNNEIPIYNSAYLNYIRTGYNYDVKTKNRQLTASIIGGVISTIGAVASGVSSAGTGGIGVAGAVALGTSAMAQFSRATFNTIQAEQNIAQKLKTAEMQGLSIAGSDDVDLMTEYTGNNKLKLVTYKVSQKIEDILFDLFYYFGYIANKQGTPDTQSRVWFNFVQADIIIDLIAEGTINLPQDLLDEVIKKYREGVTYLHRNRIEIDNVLTNVWDFEQQYENWEVL